MIYRVFKFMVLFLALLQLIDFTSYVYGEATGYVYGEA
jgi:hypothetical protein